MTAPHEARRQMGPLPAAQGAGQSRWLFRSNARRAEAGLLLWHHKSTRVRKREARLHGTSAPGAGQPGLESLRSLPSGSYRLRPLLTWKSLSPPVTEPEVRGEPAADLSCITGHQPHPAPARSTQQPKEYGLGGQGSDVPQADQRRDRGAPVPEAPAKAGN